jgi:drug/metabolite transporter (DMT)-like permease
MPALFVLLWSTGFIVARYGMPLSPPFKFLELRYLFSILFFLPWVYFARVQWPSERSQWGHLAITGILIQAGYLGGVWVGVKSGIGSGLTALIVGLQPVLTAFWLSSRQHLITKRQWTGLWLGLGGVMLVLSKKLSDGIEVTPYGLMAEIVALLSITAGTLYQKTFVKPCDVRSANTVQLMASAAITLPLALLESESIQFGAQFYYSLAWSVLGLTVGAGSLLYLLIQRGAASSVASLMYLVPPTTAAIAWILFEEPVTFATLIGVALTALGVGLVVRPPRERI